MQKISRTALSALVPALVSMLVYTDAWSRTLQQIRTQGSVNVGVALSSPWVIRRSDGELVGFEVDVAKRLARDLQVEPKIIVSLSRVRI